MIKYVRLFTLFIFNMVLFSINVKAIDLMDDSTPINEYEQKCYYIETVISDADPYVVKENQLSSSNTITKVKTANCKDSNGNVIWYVSVTATFVYDGISAECISCSHNASVVQTGWTISSVSSSYSGNSATANATAIYTYLFGLSHEYTQSVTIQCSPTGEVS